MCCFLKKCAPNPRLPGHHCAARTMNLAAGMSKHGPTRPPAMRYACLTPRRTRNPRSSTASARGRARRRSHTQAAKFANRACRAHEHGRCVYTASECSAVHFADLDTIDCNSSIKEGDVRYTNKRFGICHKRKNEAEGDRVMARSRLDSKGPEESGLLHTGSTRGPKVYGWYSFVLKGLGVFP